MIDSENKKTTPQPNVRAALLARVYCYLLRRAEELEKQTADDSTLAGASSAAGGTLAPAANVQ